MCSAVISITAHAQESVKQKEALFCGRTESLMQQQQQYQSVKKQRVELQESIRSQLQQCNKLIQTENEMFRDVQQLTAKKSKTEAGLQRMNDSLETCGGLVTSYNSFMQQTVKYIAQINKNFERLWDEFESGWVAWTVDDVVVWLKHKAGELSEKEDWALIQKQMKERKITGRSLQKFNSLTFEFTGFTHSKLIDLLVSELSALRNRYGAIEDAQADQANAKTTVSDIHVDYMCPIIKKVMQDPVLAFDGHNYERTAIEAYLKEHKKSPISGAAAMTTMVFPNPLLKSTIVAFIEGNEAADQEPQLEGDGETALV